MSHEIERRVLGALMMIGEHNDIDVQESMLLLTPYDFYDRHHCNLFVMIRHLFDNLQPFDGMRLIELVDSIDWKSCEEIITRYRSSSTLTLDAKRLIEIRVRNDIAKKLDTIHYEFNAESIPSKASQIATAGCYEVSKMGTTDENYVFTAEMMAEKYNFEDTASEQIIPTGIETLDKLNGGGFKESSMITIAGRSGMGKTGFAVHLAHNLAMNHKHHHVLFYSLEMTEDEIYEKQLTSILGKHPINLTTKEKGYAQASALDIPFTIDRKPLASIDYIETTARIIDIKKPISVIVVDYLGIVQNKSKLESHTLKQADICLRLAALALELNCIVIALTQVNRDYSNREDKCPITSDAADSSGSERSSGYWLGIYRPEVDSPDDLNLKNQFIVKCRKNRFGNIWSAIFGFNEATFQEVDQQFSWVNKPKKEKSWQDSLQQFRG